jgi:hypothetical protein
MRRNVGPPPSGSSRLHRGVLAACIAVLGSLAMYTAVQGSEHAHAGHTHSGLSRAVLGEGQQRTQKPEEYIPSHSNREIAPAHAIAPAIHVGAVKDGPPLPVPASWPARTGTLSGKSEGAPPMEKAVASGPRWLFPDQPGRVYDWDAVQAVPEPAALDAIARFLLDQPEPGVCKKSR